jgi:hypothetical protein
VRYEKPVRQAELKGRKVVRFLRRQVDTQPRVYASFVILPIRVGD